MWSNRSPDTCAAAGDVGQSSGVLLRSSTAVWKGEGGGREKGMSASVVMRNDCLADIRFNRREGEGERRDALLTISKICFSLLGRVSSKLYSVYCPICSPQEEASTSFFAFACQVCQGFLMLLNKSHPILPHSPHTASSRLFVPATPLQPSQPSEAASSLLTPPSLRSFLPESKKLPRHAASPAPEQQPCPRPGRLHRH
jgi:hypothetical protein